MPELLHLQTAEFELSIWCSDISRRQATYQATLNKRQALDSRSQRTHPQAPSISVRFSPPLSISAASFIEQPIALVDHEQTDKTAKTVETLTLDTVNPTQQLTLSAPIFFENIQYQFEWLFIDQNSAKAVEQAYLTHRSQRINDSFRFIKAQRSIPARLTGTINTANHVGWMRLPVEYIKAGQVCRSHIAFEVLPTKMSLHDDLPAMYQAIDKVFPLWRFSLVEKTEQDAAQSQPSHYFPLLWLANFGHLRAQLEQGLKVINQAPHSRLQAHTSHHKAARLKGKLPQRLGAKVKEDFANGVYDQRYAVIKKQLSVDTTENRFIKMVVTTAKKRLADFEQKLRENNKAPNDQRISTSFLDELQRWQQPLQKTLKQGFMTEVGAYNGQQRESLVLQQKIGYSSVYRIWQELKFYLDVFDSQSTISMKSVADIYEVWCFLTLRNILIDDLGFEDITAKQPTLILNDFFEYQLKDGFAGAFEFIRDDGVSARLVHEPVFSNRGADIRSYLISQRPDIVLEIALPAPSDKRFIWLFDAKYRIKTLNNRYDKRYDNHASTATEINSDINSSDFVPDDAINQMHRYRDALIRIDKDKINNKGSATIKKSRPVFGAFALYPGYFEQQRTENPYCKAINEVGIGAFALLPSALATDQNGLTVAPKNNGHYWLLTFLRQQLGTSLSKAAPADKLTSAKATASTPASSTVNNASNAVNSSVSSYQIHKRTAHSDHLAEHLYLQDAARIPYSGMQQLLYPDLTMTIALSGLKGRDASYFTHFKNGSANYYHLPQDTFLAKYKQHIVNEIRYLALAITDEQHPTSKKISKLWPIKKVTVVPRAKITVAQAGSASTSDKLYYLFQLGKPLTLKDAIYKVPQQPFKNSMKLTTLNYLEATTEFNNLTQVYDDALV